MSAASPGLARRALKNCSSRPSAWFLLFLAELSMLFSGLLPYAGLIIYPVLGILIFLVKCLAVLIYVTDEKRPISETLSQWRRILSGEIWYFVKLYLLFLLYEWMYILMIALPLLLLVAVSQGALGNNRDGLSLMTKMALNLAVLASLFLIIRLELISQIAVFVHRNGEPGAKDTIRHSITAVKLDYRLLLKSFLPPLLIAEVVLIVLALLVRSYGEGALLTVVFFLLSALLRSGLASFLTAGFTGYFKDEYLAGADGGEGRGDQPPEPVQGDVPGV